MFTFNADKGDDAVSFQSEVEGMLKRKPQRSEISQGTITKISHSFEVRLTIRGIQPDMRHYRIFEYEKVFKEGESCAPPPLPDIV